MVQDVEPMHVQQQDLANISLQRRRSGSLCPVATLFPFAAEQDPTVGLERVPHFAIELLLELK